MEQLSIPYFRELLAKNVDNLKNLCKEWGLIETDSSLPEEAHDEIRTTIGLTNLLLCQKLKQFQGLIDDSEFKRGEKEITCLDLQGFWDMVYNEVEKIQNNFEKLEKSKVNNWVFIQEPLLKVENKKKILPAIVKSSVFTKKHVSAARQRLAEAKLKMKAQMVQKTEDLINTDLIPNILVSDEVPDKKENKQNPVESTELKSAISNITNMRISKRKGQNIKQNSSKKNTPTKAKSNSKTNDALEKENILVPLSKEFEAKSPVARKGKGRGKVKEFIPLQCVTRSASKAMLAQQK